MTADHTQTSGCASVPLSSLPRGSKRRREDKIAWRSVRLSGDRLDRAPKRFGRTRARAVRKVSVCPGHATFSPRTRTHARTHARSHTPSGRSVHCVTVTTLSFYVTSRVRPTNMRATKVAARPIFIDPLRFARNSDETAGLIGHRSMPAETKVSLTGNF